MRQAAALSMVSTPTPASISGRNRAGAGKRSRAPLPNRTSSGLSAAMRAKCWAVSASNVGAFQASTSPLPRHDHALGVLDAVDRDALRPMCRAIAFCPSIRSAPHFHDVIIGGQRWLVSPRAARPVATTPCGQISGSLRARYAESFVQPLLKSSKLANVCYDIRGPVLEKARQMEEEGQHIIKLNIGNIAAFGLEPPDEIVQDMIRNLPNAAGYTDSKGLFAPRKAIVHYTQQKQVKGVTIDDVYLGNGASELITMSMNALLNDGDEVLIPAPDYPLWTASVALSGGTPVHYLCDEASDWMPDLDDMAAKITDRAPARSSSSIRTTRPARSIPTEVLEKIVELARRHGLIVFADEIYDKTLYDGHTPHLDRLARRRRPVPHLQRPVEELPLVRLPRRLDGGLGREAPCRATTSRASACWPRCACARTRRASWRSRPRSAATRASTTWSRRAAGWRASAISPISC